MLVPSAHMAILDKRNVECYLMDACVFCRHTFRPLKASNCQILNLRVTPLTSCWIYVFRTCTRFARAAALRCMRLYAQHGTAGPKYSPCQGCRLLLPPQRLTLVCGAMRSAGLQDTENIVIPVLAGLLIYIALQDAGVLVVPCV